MTRSVAELAAMVGARVEGNAQAAIHGVAPIDTAGPGQLTFLANPKYSDRLRTTRATAVIVAPPADGGSPRDLASAGVTLLEHDNPYFAFLKILTFFHPTPPPPTPGVDPTARIGHR
ncbi:MAG: UDP-3-O-(3-hydroxymyristoyl)glucosamine N-acyltransferase, partial [candidate division Zixibacteria bacterium]|nr:UDP-3-O-(3-hydroxymyristoyl)glucosamine N-acyltransferase [candidate division Zixibacteria bacterium]